MLIPVQYVKISEKYKDLLIKIKKNTGIMQWNEIFRIALCISLNEKKNIIEKDIKASILAIEWKTFSGSMSGYLSSLINVLYINNAELMNIKKEEFVQYHIERGIEKMVKLKSVNDLCKVLTKNTIS